MTFLFCYDVSKNKSRIKIAKNLERFGLRVQKSFFQINVSPQLASDIRDAILEYMDKETDRVFMYPICDACAVKGKYIGESILKLDERFIIL